MKVTNMVHCNAKITQYHFFVVVVLVVILFDINVFIQLSNGRICD
jgi:hypothetical protein